MDVYTQLLLQEARVIFSKLSEEEVSDFDSTTDFQSYWKYANEDIQSSESSCHFSHNKAASYDRYLSAMHAAELILAAATGIPLAQWGNGLTVLLEKVFGNIYIDKMRAICLLEADYNWLNKFVFAKQMIDRAFKEEIIPAEQFTKRGSQATEGVLTSGLFCDIARALHQTAAIKSVDLANCYDCKYCPPKFQGTESYGRYDVICPQKDDMVPENRIWTEQNLFWRDKMGSINGPLTGQRSSASWFSLGLHSND